MTNFDIFTFFKVFSVVFSSELLLINSAISVRRLHDLDKDGLLVLLTFVPLLNGFFELYLLFAPGTVGDNRYGADPLQ